MHSYFSFPKKTSQIYPLLGVSFFVLYLLSHLLSTHVHPFRNFSQEILVVISLFLSISFLFQQKKSQFSFPALASLPLLLVFMMATQALLGMVSIPNIVYPLMYLLLTVLAIWFGANCFGEDKALSPLSFVLAFAHLIAGLVSVAMQLTQIFGLYLDPFVMYFPAGAQVLMRPFANVAQPNQLALLLCFALASLWWLFQVGRLRAWAALVTAFMLLLGLALTQSRIAWIILPMFALLCGLRIVGERAVSRFALVGLLAFYVALVMLTPYVSEILGFAPVSALERAGGRSERSVLWQQAWAMAVQHPWLGVGWFGFGAEQVKMAADFSSTTYAEHSHNLILNFLAELGFPFTICFFAALLIWFYRTCVAGGRLRQAEVAFAVMCFIAVGVHSMVEYPLWYANVLIPMAIWMGALHQHRWQTPAVSVPRSLPAVLGLLGLVLVVLVTLDYLRVVRGFKAFNGLAHWSEVSQEAIAKPAWTLLPDYFDYFQLMNVEPRAGMRAEEIAFVERLSRRFGYVHVLNKLAEVYVWNGQEQKAVRTMVTLQRLHPLSYPTYFDYWQHKAKEQASFAAVAAQMPPRDAP